jgi:uncharacterized protein
MASLKFENGPHTGERIVLEREKTTFGRARWNDCVLAHPTASREHFYIERNAGKLFLVDHGSENGTHVNGERVSWIELNDRDTIRAGPFVMRFEAAAVESAAQPSIGASELPVSEAESGGGYSGQVSTARIYPKQYGEGIQHFNAGRYFDAHEVWEEIWLRAAGESKLFYQMLIQAAVGLHHFERGNVRGARGMHDNVIEKLSRLPSSFMSLDLVRFASDFRACLAELIEKNNETATLSDELRPLIKLFPRDDAD